MNPAARRRAARVAPQLASAPAPALAPSIFQILDQRIPTIPGWCPLDKAHRLAKLAMATPRASCVELGVYGGRSLAALGLGAAQVGGRADGIDPYAKTASLEGGEVFVGNNDYWSKVDYEAIYAQAIRDMASMGLASVVRIIRAKSLDAVGQYADSSIDVMHQGGNHSEEVSSSEATAWLPKMRARAVWVMDDTQYGATTKAQTLLVAAGFRLTEDYTCWRVYAR